MIHGQPVDARRVAAALGGRSVVLVGMMGAGKTSVGKRLASKLGLPFVDADAEIEAGAQLTIPEIFERFGEAYFRDGERKVIARLLNGGPQVLATGGGAFMNKTTRENIAAHGVSIWLKPDVEVLLARVRKKSNRPASADRRSRADPAAASWRSARRPMRSPTSPSNRATARTSRSSTRRCAVWPTFCAARRRPPGDRRRVEVPLGARAYSILIGPGVIDEAGVEIARIAPGAKCAIVTDANVAPLYLDRLTTSLAAAGLGAASIVCPPGEATKSYAAVRARFGRADRGAHRAARHRHRARRRGDRRSDRLLRRLAAPRRAVRSGPHHPPVAGRFQRRRQDGHQLAARQEPGRRVPPALPRPCRFRQPRHAERAGVSRRLRRGASNTASSTTGISSNFLEARWREVFSGGPARARGDRGKLRGQGARRRRRRDRAGRTGAAQSRPYLRARLREPDALRFGAPGSRRGGGGRDGLRVPVFPSARALLRPGRRAGRGASEERRPADPHPGRSGPSSRRGRRFWRPCARTRRSSAGG